MQLISLINIIASLSGLGLHGYFPLVALSRQGNLWLLPSLSFTPVLPPAYSASALRLSPFSNTGSHLHTRTSLCFPLPTGQVY